MSEQTVEGVRVNVGLILFAGVIVVGAVVAGTLLGLGLALRAIDHAWDED